MPTNLINQLPEEFKKAIKEFGITEAFFFNDEFYITSNYHLHFTLIESIEKYLRSQQ